MIFNTSLRSMTLLNCMSILYQLLHEYVQKFQLVKENTNLQKKNLPVLCKFPRAIAIVSKLKDMHSNIKQHLSVKSKELCT